MKHREKSHEALECGHCGAKNRMEIIGSISATEEHQPEDQAPFEAGTLYDLQLCPVCKKPVLVGGLWHDGMEGHEDWDPKVILPESGDRTARQLLQTLTLDLSCMRLAVLEARKCVSEGMSPKPKVGAVVALHGRQLTSGHRGELAPGDHAEFTVLEGKCKHEVLTGATVYTTLEPCTTRNLPKIPCATRLINRKVARVVIGMLDPDERIRGRGILALRKANIRVDLFPPELMSELEEMNREFIHERENAALHGDNGGSVSTLVQEIATPPANAKPQRLAESDDDAVLILRTWIKKTLSKVSSDTFAYRDIDARNEFDPGTTKRVMMRVVQQSANWQLEEGASHFTLTYAPPNRPPPPDREV